MHSGIFIFLAAVALVTCAEEKAQATAKDDDDNSGELNLDHHYYEGDIRLTAKQNDLIKHASDGLYTRALTNEVERLWPNGIIPYVVHPGLRPISKRNIRSAIHEWRTKTCIRLVPKTPRHKNYVAFVYEGGCSSNLGMVGGRQTISVGGPGVTCAHGNIVHEIAHCAGFFHEHSRPDRNQFIRIKWGKIRPGFYLNFKKMPASMINSQGVGYDYNSITHYGKRFFSKDGRPTIITRHVAYIGQRVRLSVKDVQQANLLYRCSAQRSKIEASKASDNKDKKNSVKPAKTPDAPVEPSQDKTPTAHEKNPGEITKGKSSSRDNNEEVSEQDKDQSGELNLDHHYLEGDMMLTKEQYEQLSKAKVQSLKRTKPVKDSQTSKTKPKVMSAKASKTPAKEDKKKAAKQSDKNTTPSKAAAKETIKTDKKKATKQTDKAQTTTPGKAAKTPVKKDKKKAAKQSDTTITLSKTAQEPVTKDDATKSQSKQSDEDKTIDNDETAGEQNIGHHDYFEGDIMLTPKQMDYIQKKRLKDGLYSRALSNDPTKLWPGGVVPYVYGKNLKPQTKQFIQSAIGEWNSKTCVHIRPKLASDFHYIEFVYKGGCSSYVGMVGNRQYISVGGPRIICKHGNIVHEIAHALGFYHEHSRPDRDDHIKVNWNNIIPGYKNNFLREGIGSVNSLGVGYDFNSVMHYGDKFFSKSKFFGLKTIETKPPGKAIGQRVGLSDLDVKQANRLYKCKVKGTRKNTVEVPPDIVIATKKDKAKTLKTTKTTTKKSHHLKKAVKQFTKKSSNMNIKQTEANTFEGITKRDEIINWDDPMIDKSDQATLMDTQQTKALTQKEKEIVAHMTSNKGKDLSEISGEENLGKHYFEGDMMLSNEQKQWFDSGMAHANPAQKRALIKSPTYLWKGHTVPYVFHSSVDALGKKYAKQAIAHWESKTCMHFPSRKKEKDYVMFVFEGGCSSRVGRVGGMQKINIGSKKNHCKKGNIIHEIGHALGFFHEQSRSDRDKYVKVIAKNVVKWYLNNFHKFGDNFVDDLGVPYDYNSIMHYGRTFFSYNYLFLPTLVPLYRTIRDKHVFIGQREGLSEMDILQANLLYKCDGRRPLSQKEIDNLFKQTQGIFEIHDYQQQGIVPCKDKYDYASCAKIKSHGYCHKFPNTMRQACGHTCQLCSTTPKNLLNKLRLN